MEHTKYEATAEISSSRNLAAGFFKHLLDLKKAVYRDRIRHYLASPDPDPQLGFTDPRV